jgi:hypothetical protein
MSKYTEILNNSNAFRTQYKETVRDFSAARISLLETLVLDMVQSNIELLEELEKRDGIVRENNS